MKKILVLFVLWTLIGISAVNAIDVHVSGTIAPVLTVAITGTTPVLGELTPSGRYVMIPGRTYTAGPNIEVNSNGRYMVQVSTPMPVGAALLGHMYAVHNPSTQLTNVVTCTMNSHTSFPLSAPVNQLFTDSYWVGYGPRTIPVTFSQSVTMADRALSSDHYELITEITVSQY